MSDIIDKASALEQLQRTRAIQAARQPVHEPDREQEGDTIICACCGVAINPKRLLALPSTTVCAPCKQQLEGNQWPRIT
ncbi:TraR/DksA C4-type zinc finger protein [Vibrio nomapromontoriensis]|uniref:TraR/DksA C4-type zinc finger protein n=1 Tax=Vibrio nomapromontoriensis TaxID=2910246 RepID=UPI003D12754F